MSQYDNLKLDHQLCFALYAATHALTRAYRSGLEKAGLTYSQYLVMLVLWEEDGISVGQIARKLDLDSGTLTPMLKRLEVAGLVARRRNNQDERVVEVTLTAQGRELEHEIAKVQNGVECKTGLSNEEFVQLRSTLQRLLQTMSADNEQAVAA